MTQNLTVSPSSVSARAVFSNIETPRLDLVALTPESLQCQVGFGSHMRRDLGAILGAQVTSEWPHEHWEPHVVDYLLNLIAESPEAAGWCRYIVLRSTAGSPSQLIGSVGSGFPKPNSGEAEVGYGLVLSQQRKGYAAEALMAMLPWLQAQKPVRAFVAQTFPHLYGSIRVLEKCGFEPAGAGYEEGAILFRRGPIKNQTAAE